MKEDFDGQKELALREDTVPAMLTEGEAVIPAPSAQDPKNKPAIRQMIAEGREANQKFKLANQGVMYANDGSGYVDADGIRWHWMGPPEDVPDIGMDMFEANPQLELPLPMPNEIPFNNGTQAASPYDLGNIPAYFSALFKGQDPEAAVKNRIRSRSRMPQKSSTQPNALERMYGQMKEAFGYNDGTPGVVDYVESDGIVYKWTPLRGGDETQGDWQPIGTKDTHGHLLKVGLEDIPFNNGTSNAMKEEVTMMAAPLMGNHGRETAKMMMEQRRKDEMHELEMALKIDAHNKKYS